MSKLDDLKQSSLDTAAAARTRISEGYDKAKTATSEAAARGREQAGQLNEKIAPAVTRGKEQVAKARTRLNETAQTQPLVLLAGATALGALIGSLLPGRRPKPPTE